MLRVQSLSLRPQFDYFSRDTVPLSVESKIQIRIPIFFICIWKVLWTRPAPQTRPQPSLLILNSLLCCSLSVPYSPRLSSASASWCWPVWRQPLLPPPSCRSSSPLSFSNCSLFQVVLCFGLLMLAGMEAAPAPAPEPQILLPTVILAAAGLKAAVIAGKLIN